MTCWSLCVFLVWLSFRGLFFNFVGSWSGKSTWSLIARKAVWNYECLISLSLPSLVYLGVVQVYMFVLLCSMIWLTFRRRRTRKRLSRSLKPRLNRRGHLEAPGSRKVGRNEGFKPQCEPLNYRTMSANALFMSLGRFDCSTMCSAKQFDCSHAFPVRLCWRSVVMYYCVPISTMSVIGLLGND